MKLMIIGATGFIGRSLKLFFQQRKNYQIFYPTRAELNLLERDECRKFLEIHRPDIIIHCAVNINSIDDSLRAFYNILSGHENFKSMLYLGSGAEYNPSKYVPLMTEEFAENSFPEGDYPLGKWIIGNDIENSSLGKVINLRLFGVYGKFEDYNRRFISNNICRVLAGHPVSLNKDMKFDYLFVDDLSSYIEKILLATAPRKKTYNICTGKPVRLSELGEIIRDLMGVKEPLRIKMGGENREYSGNPSRAIAEFGPMNLTPHKDAVATLIPYFEKMFSENSELRAKFKVL